MYELLPVKKVNLPQTPFATAWQAVLFRNYGTVDNVTLAKVLKTDEETVCREAERLGLVGVEYNPVWKDRGYITIIKNNWYLLDYDGICTLTGMSEAQLAKTLFDDDFLFVKVGNFKPEVVNPAYQPLTKEQLAFTQAQAEIVKANRVADRVNYFDFFKNVPTVKTQAVSGDGLRMVYNYNELFGDNLLTGDFSAYADEMLSGLSALGINALWKHIVLYDLVGLPFDEKFGEGWETRLKNLGVLCDKLEKYGIKLYLYLNEPRALPLSFYETRKHLLGVHDTQVGALCTSAPETQKYLYDAVRKIVETVPNLGGFFSITASENLTNCYSRPEYPVCECPRCKNRTRVEVYTEVNEIYAKALHDANSQAKLIAWNWGYTDNMGTSEEEMLEIVKKQPKEAAVMAVSEEGLIIHGDEGDASLIDYSISQIGPSERSKKVYAAAKESGHKVVAKVQINNSWECSSVPYLPCFDLNWEHLQNLQKLGMDGYMLSWSLGGYPSLNLSLVPQAMNGGTLQAWYQDNFEDEWEEVSKACACFSAGFKRFPFGVSLAYFGPQNIGCANPFYKEFSGLVPTMVGFPFDDINYWRGNFSAEMLTARLRELTELWKDGFAYLDKVKGRNALCVKRMANAAYCLLRSAYLQCVWVTKRDMAAAKEEYENTQKMLALTAEDAAIGFEACNHYLYTENNLLEKLLSLQLIIEGDRA